MLLRGTASATIRELTGSTVEKWLDIELPRMETLKADLIGETSDGGLVHLELQSDNDAFMARRMAEYYLGVLRHFGKCPLQVMLYVGGPPMRMVDTLDLPNFRSITGR